MLGLMHLPPKSYAMSEPPLSRVQRLQGAPGCSHPSLALKAQLGVQLEASLEGQGSS